MHLYSTHVSYICAGKAVKTVAVVTFAVIEYLVIVTMHLGTGDASQVSFVSLSGHTEGCLGPPRNALCATYGATSGVPFKGTVTFYTQDLQPPQVPASLTPKGSFLGVMFLSGKVTYMSANGRWLYMGLLATIYDVSGGVVLGKYFQRKETSSILISEFLDVDLHGR